MKRRSKQPERDEEGGAPGRSRLLTPTRLHNPWPRRFAIAGAGLAILAVGATAVYALARDGEKAGSQTSPEEFRDPPAVASDIYYLAALAARVRPSGCTARIRFTWKPHYNADRHFGEVAVIRVTGPEIAGLYRRPFRRGGVTLEPRPVRLISEYTIWVAKVVSVGGEPPDNDTTIQAAGPASDRC